MATCQKAPPARSAFDWATRCSGAEVPEESEPGNGVWTAALRALQSERLKATVKRVYENVPMYRRRMADVGIEPGDIRSIDDLKLLPFTDKPDLRDQFPYGLFAEPLEKIVRVHGSSGTTGMPIIAGYTQKDLDIWTEGMARTLTAAGAGPGDIIQIATRRPLHRRAGRAPGRGRRGAMVIPGQRNTPRQSRCAALGTTMRAARPLPFPGRTTRDGIPLSEFKLKAGRGAGAVDENTDRTRASTSTR